MQYIHASAIEFHGNLKSANVVVDSRWTCKIADYGMRRIREGEQLFCGESLVTKDDNTMYFRMYWLLLNLGVKGMWRDNS